MDKKPPFLDQVFDNMSVIPNLRNIFKFMWVFSTVYFGFAILMEGVSIFTGNSQIRPEWVKNLLMWAGVNPFFAYVLYLWNKREQEVQEKSKKTS
jgi:hypothetical protein